MGTVIWRQPLDIKENGIAEVRHSEDGHELSVANKQGRACAWFLTNSSLPQTTITRIRVVPTGDDNQPGDLVWKEFLGTVLFEHGTYVFHFFIESVDEDPLSVSSESVVGVAEVSSDSQGMVESKSS